MFCHGEIVMRSVIMVLFLCLSACQRSLQEAEKALPAVGSALPAFSLAELDGQRVSDRDLHGRPSVVALWSSTCGSSRAALAGIAALHREYASRGLRVLVLADDSSASAVRAVLDSAGVRVPVALASGTIDQIFAPSKRWPWQKGVALPSFLVVDAAGTVKRRVIGIEQDPAMRMGRVRQSVAELIP
jgi:peroxiredoxin